MDLEGTVLSELVKGKYHLHVESKTNKTETDSEIQRSKPDGGQMEGGLEGQVKR